MAGEEMRCDLACVIAWRCAHVPGDGRSMAARATSRIGARVAGVAFLSILLGLAPAAASEWQRIDASAPFVDRDGQPRTPGCSAGPVRTETGALVAADSDFSFFVRPGDPQRLAIILDGGGACFDGATCIGSALGGKPLYALEVDETPERLERLGGIADASVPDNPIAGFTQVFIPYCTGDVHIGAADATYVFDNGNGPVQWTIQHRGYDNVVAVLDWVSDHYETVGAPPHTVLLTGASAGGYGAQFAYPAVHQRFPEGTRMHLLTDSANWILSADFNDRVLGPNGLWAVWDNLAVELVNAVAAGADDMPVALNDALGRSFPQTRFGQYTHAFDAVQVFYYNVTQHPDDPRRWLDASELMRAGLTWTTRARLNMRASAITLPNYRMYLAKGSGHTIIGDDGFYTQRSGDGIAIRDWVEAMLAEPVGAAWRNASCEPYCLR
jgi:hypothetical protein